MATPPQTPRPKLRYWSSKAVGLCLFLMFLFLLLAAFPLVSLTSYNYAVVYYHEEADCSGDWNDKTIFPLNRCLDPLAIVHYKDFFVFGQNSQGTMHASCNGSEFTYRVYSDNNCSTFVVEKTVPLTCHTDFTTGSPVTYECLTEPPFSYRRNVASKLEAPYSEPDCTDPEPVKQDSYFMNNRGCYVQSTPWYAPEYALLVTRTRTYCDADGVVVEYYSEPSCGGGGIGFDTIPAAAHHTDDSLVQVMWMKFPSGACGIHENNTGEGVPNTYHRFTCLSPEDAIGTVIDPAVVSAGIENTPDYIMYSLYWTDACSGLWTIRAIGSTQLCSDGIGDFGTEVSRRLYFNSSVQITYQWDPDTMGQTSEDDFYGIFNFSRFVPRLNQSDYSCYVPKYEYSNFSSVSVIRDPLDCGTMELDGPSQQFHLALENHDSFAPFSSNVYALPLPAGISCHDDDLASWASDLKHRPPRDHYVYVFDTDFCINQERWPLGDNFGQSFKGGCVNGILSLRNYTLVDTCENVWELIEEDFCFNDVYYTCWPHRCHDIEFYEVDSCSGHGDCIDWDNCTCQTDYSGDDCGIWHCDGKVWNETDLVCSDHGNCSSPESCECDDMTHGTYCELPICYGFLSTQNGLVCSGHGICQGINDCQCSLNYTGMNCSIPPENTNDNDFVPEDQSTLIVAIGAAAGGTILLLIGIGIIIAILSFLIVGKKVRQQKERLEVLDKIKNVDTILAEQEAEEDLSVAHLKIDPRMFHVDYDTIKIERKIGEGGSNSVVYRAKWRGLQVAFKCFKTRTVFESQDSFQEFEKEVNILANVTHPNILRFYGATMNPPREFCDRGDIKTFLPAYFEEEGDHFPFDGKLRFFFEIASATGHLHSMSIIHRDMKCENVLVTAQQMTRLMDFGLSKMVDEMSVKTKRVGTSVYMAPEVVKGEDYGPECDIYSFSIMMFEILSENFSPYGDKTTFNLEFKVANDATFRPDLTLLSDVLGDEEWLRRLIVDSWQAEPELRPSFDEIGEAVTMKRWPIEKGDAEED